MATGIEVRKGPRGTKYRATVWSGRDEKFVRKQFDSLGAAKAWRVDAQHALSQGTLRPATAETVREAAERWLEQAEAGTVLSRSQSRFKPSTLRGYKRALKLRVYPTALASQRLSDVRRRDVQALVDGLLAKGVSASTIRNTIDPLRSIFRRAVRQEDIAINTTHDLEVPADDSRREHVATREEATALIEALSEDDRGLWTTAFYTGLRRGELRELRWSDVDLDAKVIGVRRALDDDGEVVSAKTKAGEREVPILRVLYAALLSHKLRTGRGGDDLVFGRAASDPFVPSSVRRRALSAWEAAELQPISLHECRHTATTEMRAAGLDFKMIQSIIGHSSVTTTFDRYTHVSREHLRQAGEQLDAHYAV